MVTIRDVAAAAGVSQATAARALNGYGSVSAKALEKVSASAELLGYTTNVIAQGLRLGQMRTIGFVPGDIENPFFATVARHLGDTLEAGGYLTLLSSSDERVERERKIIDTLRAQMVAGLVIAPASGASAPHLSALVADGFPLVLIDRRIEGVDADSVTVDNEGGGFHAVSHLIELGHTRIAVLVDDLAISSSAERVAGYTQAFTVRERSCDPKLVAVGGASREGARAAASRLLSMPDRPTALFTTDNYMTEGALRAIQDAGLAIPEDISLIGFDDFNLATFVQPGVTVVSQPIAELGQEAGRLMLRRLTGERDAPHNVSLLAELVVRGSARPLGLASRR